MGLEGLRPGAGRGPGMAPGGGGAGAKRRRRPETEAPLVLRVASARALAGGRGLGCGVEHLALVLRGGGLSGQVGGTLSALDLELRALCRPVYL